MKVPFLPSTDVFILTELSISVYVNYIKANTNNPTFEGIISEILMMLKYINIYVFLSFNAWKFSSDLEILWHGTLSFLQITFFSIIYFKGCITRPHYISELFNKNTLFLGLKLCFGKCYFLSWTSSSFSFSDLWK